MSPGSVEMLALLETLHEAIQTRVRRTLAGSGDAAAVARETRGDTLYALDADVEPLILEFFETTLAPRFPCTLVAEGVNEDRPLVLGDPGAPDRIRVLMDPIDGTRGLMYDKRPAWILTGVAPDHGEATRLRHITLALQTEIPTTKMTLADQLRAERGQGWDLRRTDLATGAVVPVTAAPSTADHLDHGFAQISRFFTGGKDILAALEEALFAEVAGPVTQGKARIFEDQYISNAGQLYEIIVGHDRFTADIRPRLEPALRKRGEAVGIACHPYDMATALIAEEAGVELTDGHGRPFDAPMDTTTPVAFIAYANAALRTRIEPVFLRLMEERLP